MKQAGILCVFLACGAGGAAAQQPAAPPKPAPVQVVVPHWYVGIGGAQTIFDIQADSVAAPGATASTLNEGQNRSGCRLFGGYRVHRNVAIEGALTDYGKFTSTREVTAPVSGNLIAQTRIRGASLEVVGILPFNNGFSFLGKVGGMLAQTQIEYRTEGAYTLPAGTSTSVRNHELVGKYGVGLGYALTERIGLKMEYEVSQKVGEQIEGDLKAAFFSVQVRF